VTTLPVALAAMIAVVAAAGIWLAVAALRRGLDARLSTTDAELRRLGDAAAWRERGTDSIRQEVSAFRSAFEQLRVREEERRSREDEGWATLHRVAAVLAGGQRVGRAGENILRESLAHLPPSMVVTDFRVNGRVVEFGLVLPDGRTLPIDSKWPAGRELRALAETTDPGERDRLIRAIEKVVAERAREVSVYRDPAMTPPVAVAAVPDAAYAILRRAHADAYRQGVLVIPYSMALPVVLFLHSLVARFGAVGDVEACLSEVLAGLDAIEGTLENKLTRASTMLQNGTDELRAHVGKARATLSRARQADPPGWAEEAPRFAGLSR
jgi:DNA recombination protein RmuC